MCLLTASVCGLRGLLYLEVVVLVDRAAGVRRHISHGCQVYVLTGEEEEIHTAALCYTVLRQLLIHSFLRLEQGLTGTKQRITFGENVLSYDCQLSDLEFRISREVYHFLSGINKVLLKLLTFSLSVLTSFLSSLFFSLPGASAVGMEEWKMKSFPLHSAAWRGKNDEREKISKTKIPHRCAACSCPTCWS